VIEQTASSTPKDKLSVKGKGNKRRRSERSPPPAGGPGESLAIYCSDSAVKNLFARLRQVSFRGHHTRVADTVRHLLLEQTTDDPEMEHVKDAVFGVSGGEPRCCRFIFECIIISRWLFLASQVESRSC
jgi:hypothetical protein